MRFRFFYWTFLLLLGLLPGTVQAAGQSVWVVSPQGPFTTIQQALDQASTGDTILVKGGVYPTNLVVDKSVRLVGEDWPVIDGGGDGMVVLLAAPGIQFQGFEVRGSGSEPDRDHAGIAVQAADILVENNRLVDVLFGVFVAQADRAVVRGNDITSKSEYVVARKGDAIRVWYSQGVVIENNWVHQSRDLVAWYSKDLVFRNNRIQDGRYGVHLMYCDDASVSGNILLDNSVGVYVMYSRQVTLIGNDIRRQRGPSGYALGFKDADNILVQDNLLVDNRAGIFIDGTPFQPHSYARFERNIIAFNDIGVLMLSFVKHAEFRANTLWENVQQTALQGSGKAGENTWDGNYWSDYAGYDADGDGFGDVPYRSDRFFEGMLDREPRLRALLFSPAAQAIEFASLSFPVIKPQSKLEDNHPTVVPLAIPADALPTAAAGRVASLAVAGLALLVIGCSIWLVGVKGEKWMQKNLNSPKAAALAVPAGNSAQALVQVAQLSKRYGKALVVNELSLIINQGESLALWGENGAGKTTLLKAILGLLHFQGQIHVAGQDVSRRGKQARSHIGYVPQEAVFYDMSVQATMAFYTRLKKVSPQRSAPLLDKLGLLSHQHKSVSALSGGLKQRLALAVALLADPPLLLLDEPTANLDARARKEYLGLLLKLRQEGKTILFASHRLEEVETLADRVVILEAGQKVDEIRSTELRGRLSPQVLLTVWVAQDQRQKALDLLTTAGWAAHLNGRGTVVARMGAGDKLAALQQLGENGIAVHDFEIEGVMTSWN